MIEEAVRCFEAQGAVAIAEVQTHVLFSVTRVVQDVICRPRIAGIQIRALHAPRQVAEKRHRTLDCGDRIVA